MHRRGEANLRRFPQRCPFCPSQTKRMFDETGLFQHAIAISKFNPNPETVRAHSALLNELTKGLNKGDSQGSSLLHPSANVDSAQQNDVLRAREAHNKVNLPAREKHVHEFHQNGDLKVVWPWMGIVVNIDFEQLATNGKRPNGKDNNGYANLVNDLWNLDLKGHFSCFNPKSVHPLWNQRLAVLDFGHDLLGSFDAEDFAKGFARCARGKLNFQNMESLKIGSVQEMFGWIADENDYNLNNAMGEFLRRRGSLRVMPRVSHAWSEQHDQLFQDMRLKLQDKNSKVIELKREVCNLQTLACQAENDKYLAESQFSLKELKHKQELETIRKNYEKVIQTNKDEFLKEKAKLSSLQDEPRDLKKKSELFEEGSSKSTPDETMLQQLIDMAEEKERMEDDLQRLTYKEREANDKVQNAMKAATEVLQSDDDTRVQSIGLKKMGVLNEGPWMKAFAVKFKDEKDGLFNLKMLITKWDKYLRDGSWFPYKRVTLEGGKLEEVIDAEDEKLAKLRQEFGVEVYMTVVDALNELQEYNRSGRFPVLVPWNSELGRAAQLDEIIRYLANDGAKRKRMCSLRS